MASCRFLWPLLLSSALAQQGQPPLPVSGVPPATGNGLSKLTAPYQGFSIEAARTTDDLDLRSFLRAGNLSLSLQDAIRLAVANNLDVEIQRYTPRLAETDILRANAGGLLRGISLNTREGPTGVGGPPVIDVTGLPQQNLQENNGQGNPTVTTQVGAQGAANLSLSGPVPLSPGPLPPNLDTALVGVGSYGRTNQPQANTFVTGTNALIQNTALGNFGIEQGFWTGGTLTFDYDAARLSTNNRRTDINPNTASGLGLTFRQPLLQGFGFAVNKRFIRVAQNNRRVSDFAFQQQLIATVFAVTRLYRDLGTLNSDLQVKRQTLALTERLLRENQEQEQAGTLAPIEVVRTRAEVARDRRELTLAETRVRQQEIILKDYLTRGVLDDPLLLTARVVLTDPLQPPQQETVEPIQDLTTRAFQKRPDVNLALLQLENSEVTLRGTQSALLPTLDLFVTGRSSGLVGQVNPLPPLSGNTGVDPSVPTTPLVRQPDPLFIGGSGVTQIFQGRFPDYTAELRLNVPLRNRVARADLARDQLLIRQQELRLRQLRKQVQVDVANALIAVEQSRAAYQAAQEARGAQEQSLAAEQEKFSAGVSTVFLVVQYQRDFAQAQSAEVVALGDYLQSRNALDRATGTILDVYGVQLEDAYRGSVPATTPTVPVPQQP